MPTGIAPPARNGPLYPDLRPLSRPKPDDRVEIVSFFKTRELLKRMPDDVVRALALAASHRRYAAGQHVCHAGDPAREIWLVQEGRVCVNQYSSNGGRLCIDIMVPGDFLGLAAVTCETYIWEVLAVRDTRTIVIPREAMLRMMDEHPELGREVLHIYAQRLQYVETLLYLSREKVEKRLAAALLYLHHKFGSSLSFTRAEIGQMAGTTAETAMRILKRLEGQDLLEGRRGQIIIRDLNGIRARSGLV